MEFGHLGGKHLQVLGWFSKYLGPDGHLKKTNRYRLSLSCNGLDLRAFPFDTQILPIRLKAVGLDLRFVDLPETNSSLLKKGLLIGHDYIFQPPIFRGKLAVSFRKGTWSKIAVFFFHRLQARNQSSLKATKMPVGVILVGPEGLDLWTCGAKSWIQDFVSCKLELLLATKISHPSTGTFESMIFRLFRLVGYVIVSWRVKRRTVSKRAVKISVMFQSLLWFLCQDSMVPLSETWTSVYVLVSI